jgi:hypothetical protein
MHLLRIGFQRKVTNTLTVFVVRCVWVACTCAILQVMHLDCRAEHRGSGEWWQEHACAAASLRLGSARTQGTRGVKPGPFLLFISVQYTAYVTDAEDTADNKKKGEQQDIARRRSVTMPLGELYDEDGELQVAVVKRMAEQLFALDVLKK